jgi:hypothetical protein
MEFKLRIWSAKQPDAAPEPPRYTGFEFAALPTVAVGPDEVPPEVCLNAPGIAYMTEFVLGPGAPGDMIRSKARKYVGEQASWLDGVVEDLQPEPGCPRFVFRCDRYAFPPVNEFTEKMYISLWYPASAGLYSNAAGIVSAFGDCIPFCLPERYGFSVPPETGWAEAGGREAFEAFLAAADRPVVWFPSLPAVRVTARDAAVPGTGPGGHVSYLSVELPEGLFRYPEWNAACRRLLRRLALVGADPATGAGGAFFGQFVRRREGVSSWWWRGIPDELGEACVLGGPYARCASQAGTAISPGHYYYEEPEGPGLPPELISKPVRRLFRRRGAYSCPDDFTLARTVPEELFAAADRRDVAAAGGQNGAAAEGAPGDGCPAENCSEAPAEPGAGN